MTISMAYRLTYTVQAPNRLMALMAAGRLLRSTVSVTEVVDTIPLNGDWWSVILDVEESNEPPEPKWLHEESADRLRDAISGERRDWHRVEVDPADVAAVIEAADPITAAKAEADR